MASSKVTDEQLKHLGFVRIIALNSAVLVSNLYNYAKQNSGPLKPAVGRVENAVTTVVSPVYERFKGVPGDILVFLDKKVDEATYKFDECAPPAAKSVAYKVQSAVKKASQAAQDLAEEAKVDGPVAAINHAGTISKDFALTLVATAWYKANQYPAFRGVLKIAVPTAAHWSDKYNKLVEDMKAKGYSFFKYVPLVPVKEVAKAYNNRVAAAANEVAQKGSSSESGSDKE